MTLAGNGLVGPNLVAFMPPNSHTEFETRASYTQRGFHPVRPGDVYHDGRYKIFRKLGYGAAGTIWLAEQTQYFQLAGSLTKSPQDWTRSGGKGSRQRETFPRIRGSLGNPEANNERARCLSPRPLRANRSQRKACMLSPRADVDRPCNLS
jgi:hypothetical protein